MKPDGFIVVRGCLGSVQVDEGDYALGIKIGDSSGTNFLSRGPKHRAKHRYSSQKHGRSVRTTEWTRRKMITDYLR